MYDHNILTCNTFYTYFNYTSRAILLLLTFNFRVYSKLQPSAFCTKLSNFLKNTTTQWHVKEYGLHREIIDNELHTDRCSWHLIRGAICQAIRNAHEKKMYASNKLIEAPSTKQQPCTKYQRNLNCRISFSNVGKSYSYASAKSFRQHYRLHYVAENTFWIPRTVFRLNLFCFDVSSLKRILIILILNKCPGTVFLQKKLFLAHKVLYTIVENSWLFSVFFKSLESNYPNIVQFVVDLSNLIGKFISILA